MDLTYLFAVVAFLGTSFELAAALTGRFAQRTDHAPGQPQTIPAGRAQDTRPIQHVNGHP
jgi:hypothetical protein